MSEFGVVKIFKSDNGSPFQSEAFTAELGFSHRRITPLWPAANSFVENFMKGLSKVCKISSGHSKPFVQLLHNFLRDYRPTPHPTTGYSPFQLLFGQLPRTRLPEFPFEDDSRTPDDVRLNDYKAKEKQKEYADIKRRAVPNLFQKGDSVLVTSHNKVNLRFADPSVVLYRRGSLVTVVNKDGKHITPNM